MVKGFIVTKVWIMFTGRWSKVNSSTEERGNVTETCYHASNSDNLVKTGEEIWIFMQCGLAAALMTDLGGETIRRGTRHKYRRSTRWPVRTFPLPRSQRWSSPWIAREINSSRLLGSSLYTNSSVMVLDKSVQENPLKCILSPKLNHYFSDAPGALMGGQYSPGGVLGPKIFLTSTVNREKEKQRAANCLLPHCRGPDKHLAGARLYC